MKIKRFTDKDSRRAMAKIRAEMGPDAVILSNKKVGGQVELVAAMDFDEAALGANFGASSLDPDPLTPNDQVDSPTLIDLQRELGNLRNMLEGKLSHLSWRDTAGHQSTKAVVYNRLIGLGLSKALSGQFVDKLAISGDLEALWTKALEMLGNSVPLMAGDSLLLTN